MSNLLFVTDRASRAGTAEQRGEGNRFQIRGEGLEVGIHGRGGNLTLPAPIKWGAVPACPQQGGLRRFRSRSAPGAQGRPAGQGVRASPRRPVVTLQELLPAALPGQDLEDVGEAWTEEEWGEVVRFGRPVAAKL